MDKFYVFIYNLEQAYFYIGKGVRPKKLAINPSTNTFYFKFVREDTQKHYQEWKELSKELNKEQEQ